MRQFTWQRPDGTQVEGNYAAVLAAVGRRILAGDGKFNVVREPAYNHPGLSRLWALRVFGAICSERLDVGERVWVVNGRGEEVFRCKRIKYHSYENPFRKAAGLFPLRQDMGADYGVRDDSPIFTVGPGVITRADRWSTWPRDTQHPDGGSIICYRLTAGPAKDKCIYFAENITLADLKVGDEVTAGRRIATLHPGLTARSAGRTTGTQYPRARDPGLLRGAAHRGRRQFLQVHGRARRPGRPDAGSRELGPADGRLAQGLEGRRLMFTCSTRCTSRSICSRDRVCRRIRSSR